MKLLTKDTKEIVGTETNSLHSAETYDWEKPLIERLGLKTFRNIPSGQEINLGKVQIPGGEFDVSIKVMVEVMPAQFYKFDVTIKPTRGIRNARILKSFKIETGSGCFTEYWGKLEPLFLKMAEGMIVFKGR